MKQKTLKSYMKTNGFTDRHRADMFGLSVSFINMVKNGKARPNPDLAAKISEKTGVPLLTLLYPEKIRVNEKHLEAKKKSS